jgi:hypothetical protein
MRFDRERNKICAGVVPTHSRTLPPWQPPHTQLHDLHECTPERRAPAPQYATSMMPRLPKGRKSRNYPDLVVLVGVLSAVASACGIVGGSASPACASKPHGWLIHLFQVLGCLPCSSSVASHLRVVGHIGTGFACGTEYPANSYPRLKAESWPGTSTICLTHP